MIPKIIHHIWMSDNKIPEINIYAANSVKENNKDFEYRLWKDEDVEYLMKTEFNEYYDKFNKLPRLIMKIDMFRYFLMYKFGGLYTDMDYLMFKPFDLLNYEIVIPANRDKDSNGNYTNLGNCIFASIPNHEFWKGLIDTLFTIDRQNQTVVTLKEQVDEEKVNYNLYKTIPQWGCLAYLINKKGIEIMLSKLPFYDNNDIMISKNLEELNSLCFINDIFINQGAMDGNDKTSEFGSLLWNS